MVEKGVRVTSDHNHFSNAHPTTMNFASPLSLFVAFALAGALRSVSALNFTLPPLPYGYASLEPFIDNQVLSVDGSCPPIMFSPCPEHHSLHLPRRLCTSIMIPIMLPM